MTNSAAPAQFTEGHLQVEGIDVRYRSAGTGPTLIHLSAAGSTWSAAHDLLARSLRVVMVDRPGSDAVSVAPETSSRPTLAGLPNAVAGDLGIDRFNLWGTADGALAALWAAVQHPERLDALVLESPPALWPDPEMVLPDGAASPPAGDLGAEGDLVGRLGGINIPTLALFGTLDEGILPPARRAYRQHIQTCSFILVYAAGSRIGADRPEAFANVVADFVERRETFVVGRANHLIHP
jgi:pimeloyl-ACP methyl ester carboxylesterase